MNTLEALGNDRSHTQEQGSLSGPVTRAARAIFLASNDKQRYALLLVAHGCLVDGGLLSIRQIEGIVTFFTGRQAIAQANVAKGTAHHHFVITAPRPIGVEVALLDALLNQVTTSRTGR